LRVPLLLQELLQALKLLLQAPQLLQAPLLPLALPQNGLLLQEAPRLLLLLASVLLLLMLLLLGQVVALESPEGSTHLLAQGHLQPSRTCAPGLLLLLPPLLLPWWPVGRPGCGAWLLLGQIRAAAEWRGCPCD
jgi:hypothetical protein